MDGSFGNLVQFTEVNDCSALIHTHNDPEDPYYFKLFEFVVLGSEFLPERDLALITVASLWMLANVLRAIIAGWGFQLNGDVTGKVCRARQRFQNGITCFVFAWPLSRRQPRVKMYIRSHGMTCAQLFC